PPSPLRARSTPRPRSRRPAPRTTSRGAGPAPGPRRPRAARGSFDGLRRHRDRHPETLLTALGLDARAVAVSGEQAPAYVGQPHSHAWPRRGVRIERVLHADAHALPVRARLD